MASKRAKAGVARLCPTNETRVKPTKYAPSKTLDEFDREESGYDVYCDALIPAFSSSTATVAVCIVSSDEYAPFAAIVVQSAIVNATTENNYDIVILSDDMCLRNRWRIEKMAEGHANISVRVIDITKKVESFTFYTWAHFTSKTYYRLLTPDLFCAYDKVIYLDSDVVVNHDLADLFHTELGDYLLAAAYDTHVVAYCSQNPPLEQRDYNINTLKLKEPEIYFQAGVSLFNVKAFRENYERGYLIKQGASHKLRWLDQDLINMLCQGKIMRLPNKWNVMIANMPDFIDEYYLPQELRKEYFEARKAPYIIHYVGRAMPCYTTSPDLYEYFWKYARLTPFYEILLQRMTIDYTTKSLEKDKSHAQIIKYIEQLQCECAYLRAQYKALCEQNHIAIPRGKRHFRKRVKEFLKFIANMLLPVGTKRRMQAACVYRKLRNLG